MRLSVFPLQTISLDLDKFLLGIERGSIVMFALDQPKELELMVRVSFYIFRAGMYSGDRNADRPQSGRYLAKIALIERSLCRVYHVVMKRL